MIESIKGTIVRMGPLKLVLATQTGLSYRLFVPSTVQEKVQLSADALFYTCLVIREEAHTLYGFLEEVERDLFEVLLTLNGIGPKTAIAMLSNLGKEGISQAASANDAKQLSRVPGIGLKTAQKLLIEIKDKIAHLPIELSTSSETNDAIQALIQLGFSPQEARRSVDKALKNQQDASTATLISLALHKEG